MTGPALPFFQRLAERLEAPAALPRQIAVPPVRDVPNEHAVEFLWSAYGQLAAGGSTFVALTDPQTTVAFVQNLGITLKGRLDALTVYCPDMVADVAPYIFASLVIGGRPSSAWGFLPVYPRTGVAAPAFETVVDVPPNTNITFAVKNTDPINAHFVGVYLHGWYWPTDLQEG